MREQAFEVGRARAADSPRFSALAAEDVAATLVVRVGYRGTDFSGFAEQPGQRTVAGALRKALETALRRPVDLECAGRTDAGVHALGQVISVPVKAPELQRPAWKLLSSLAALTPDDVSIRGLYRAPAGFSARFDALERSYRYRIACGFARPVMAWSHAWWLRAPEMLDTDAMQQAACCLIGEHDFKSFCKASSTHLLEEQGRSTCRELTSLEVKEVVEAGERLVCVDVEGNAFLHNMVRIIVGSLVEVGRGHRDAAWLAQALAARERSAAGPTAPAQGLSFERVVYPEGLLSDWDSIG